MSEEALDGNVEHPELAELAQSIRDEQSAEIELMQGLPRTRSRPRPGGSKVR
jgi:uncharacterized protein (DUF305 family)